MGRAGVTVHGKGRLLWLMMFWNGQGCILESFADSSLKCKSLLKLFKFLNILVTLSFMNFLSINSRRNLYRLKNEKRKWSQGLAATA